MYGIHSRSLFRSKPSKMKLPRIGTFDVETRGLGGELIMSAVCDDSDRVSTQKTVIELLEVLLSRKNRGITWFAHNGANYDFKYIIDELVQMKLQGRIYDLEFLVSGNKFIQVTVKHHEKSHHHTVIRDSFALIPAPLAAVSKTFAPQYVKGHINFDAEDFNPKNPEHIQYLHNDVLGLRHSLLTFYRLCIEHFEVVPAVTAASTAMKAWKRTIPENSIYFRTHNECETFVRRSYFGGMVYLKNVNVENDNMVKLDISGAYGYAMKTFAMPVGGAVHTDTYEPDHIGFYRVKVIAPKNLEKYIIGVKTKTGVIWARGSFETTIDSYTFEYALSRGYSLEVIEGYYFERKEYIFKEFIEKCERLEFKNKGNAIGDTAKLMRNSLYGKFGTNPDKIEYGINKAYDDGWSPMPDETTGLPHEYLCTRDIVIDASYIMPHWASCITACVRIYLDKLDAIAEYSFVYNDTDSSVIPQSVYERIKDKLPSNKEYGMFKLETVYDMFLIKGPKAYIGKLQDTYQDNNGNIIEYDMKAKGIPRRMLTPETMINGGVIEFTSLNGIIPMLRDGKPIRNDIHRTVTDIRNSAHWICDEHNNVLPLELGD